MSASIDVLLVEDDNFKQAQVAAELRVILPDANLRTASSLSSARAEIQLSTDLLVLDMSLPSYDVGPGEPGGQAQGFAGQRLLHFMADFGIDVPTIVLTQFEILNEGTQQLDLEGLRLTLRRHFPSLVKGVIYYASSSDEWRASLRKLVLGLDNISL
ncbi:MAG: hypothetical protein ACTHJ9_18000 [Rhodanobacter sp.]